MKTTSLIGGAAFSIFVVILLVSGFTMYQSVYGSASSVHVNGYKVEYTPQGVIVNASVSVTNPGQFPVNLQSAGFGNQVGAGSSGIFNLLINENMTNLSLLGMPIHNFSYYAKLTIKMASYMFSLIKVINLTNVKILALFSSFNATASGGNLLTLAFHYLSNLNFSHISVFLHGNRIGTIPLGNNYTYGQSVAVTGNVNTSIESGTPLTFMAGNYWWNATCS